MYVVGETEGHLRYHLSEEDGKCERGMLKRKRKKYGACDMMCEGMVRTMGRRRRGDRARGAGGKDVCVLDVGRDGTRRSPATPPPRERWGGRGE